MPKPILLAIDDDISVLEAVVQDLRRQYGEHYRILRAASGLAALDICRQLKQRGDTVALFLSDQRMPGMNGVELLQQAMVLFPEAKRVLLTAYADTEAAIRAINSAKIHYYLNKPWDPPEEKLYPVLDDLMEAWKQGYKPPFEGMRVIGMRWSATDHAVRDFLSRNRIPYQWLNPEGSPEAAALLKEKGIDDAKLPVVLFGDGTALVQPSTTELATKVGLRTEAKQEFYDVVVIGAGPAGLAAGVYGASEGLRTLVVEAEAPGGQAGSSSRIENYLGFPAGLSGEELGKRAFFAGDAIGSGVPDAASDLYQVREPVPHRAYGGRARGDVPRVPDLDGRLLLQAGCAGGRSLQRCGDVLRSGADGGDLVHGRGGLHHRRGELGGAGGYALFAIRLEGADAGSGGVAGEEHVEVPDRSDRGDLEHCGRDQIGAGEPGGRRPPELRHDQDPCGRGVETGKLGVHLHWGGAEDGLAA